MTTHAARAHAYENPRPEVQRHVPSSASRILDLGCSSGALGAAIKARQPAHVVGVEVDPEYAGRAREVLDEVLEGDIEELFAPGGAAAGLGEFDCLIAADVLEHLRDPWSVLRAAARHVRPGGTVVVSLPNIRYWHTFAVLGVRGTWPRDDVGIFDRTHLRFFALRDAIDLIEHAGLAVRAVDPQHRLRPLDLPLEGRHLVRRPRLSPFFAFQYVIAAAKPG